MMGKDSLASLTKLEPEKLVSKAGKDSLAEFVLALSLVFNDLKGIVNWRDHLALQQPEEGVISAEPGEWIGFDCKSIASWLRNCTSSFD
jgi:hypothetical protein